MHHPRILAAAHDVEGRWRDLPPTCTWHLRQASANALPCLCGPGSCLSDCVPALPGYLLPDPEHAERELMHEAARGWITWAAMLSDLDDPTDPARLALRALRLRQQAARSSAGTGS